MSKIQDDTEVLQDENLYNITYAAIIQACDGEPFTASISEAEVARAVTKCVNIGIDSRLQACFVPDRGDDFCAGDRRIGGKIVLQTMECTVSPESLPVLLRRLFEGTPDMTPEEIESGERWAADVLSALGFESGVFVGRDD